MRYWEIFEDEKGRRGVRKFFDWGYSEVYMSNLEDCFTPQEVDEVIIHLDRLPQDAWSKTEVELYARLKDRRKQRRDM